MKTACGLEIVTPHPGVDFTDFSVDLLKTVTQNWLAKMPAEAKQETAKGKTVVRFSVQQDGSLSSAPTVDISSGTKSLDDAAISAIRASAPFEHLPVSFKGPSVELRLAFLYKPNPYLPLSASHPQQSKFRLTGNRTN